jgi:hypothetical protein
MLEDFAGNSFVLTILQRNTVCKPMKTSILCQKYGWGVGRMERRYALEASHGAEGAAEPVMPVSR